MDVVSVLLVEDLVVDVSQIEVDDDIVDVLPLLEGAVVVCGHDNGVRTQTLGEMAQLNCNIPAYSYTGNESVNNKKNLSIHSSINQ